jgi:putative thioredoxin
MSSTNFHFYFFATDMINVTVENFEAEVVAASAKSPFWSISGPPWCGPCKVIGPLLEKVETRIRGPLQAGQDRLRPAAGTGQAFGIRSIPTCVLMVGGKPVDGFMGAQSEGEVKAFLDKHVPSAEVLEAQSEAEDAQALIAAGDPQAALHKLHESLTINPGNDDARYDYVKLLIENDMLDDAEPHWHRPWPKFRANFALRPWGSFWTPSGLS